MKEEDKIIKSIATLLQQTQDGSLIWEVGDIPRELDMTTDDIIGVVYVSTKSERCLRLYSFKTKRYYDEDCYHWQDGVTLEVSNEVESSWWEFPHNPIIWDLLEAVKFKTVEVEGFLDSIISENSEDFDS